ncbi:MAG TPA: hypothetical protein VND40_03675 [Nitrososphaerales archaeon]|nr:hypothetical protein [Nitrososphaerales archaeon]
MRTQRGAVGSAVAVVLLIIGLAVGAAVTYEAVSTSNTPKLQAADTSEVSSLQSQLATWQSNATVLKSQITRLDNQTAFDAQEISSLQANATSAGAEIASLQGLISSDKSQILSLQNANSTDSVQIQTLEANATAAATRITILSSRLQIDDTNVGALETNLASDQGAIYDDVNQIDALQAPHVSGNFTDTASCAVSGDCSYSIDGVYANFGTAATNNASVTFILYSEPSMAGHALCTLTVALGNIPGRTVAMFPEATCASGSSTHSLSLGWTFTHS